VKLRRVQIVRALREVAQSSGRTMRGVALQAALLTAHLVTVSTLTQQGRWDPALSLSGREMGRGRVRRRSLLVNIGVRPFLQS
jgi:hypothetical protein